MRTPAYLSPTGIGTWLKDRQEFYLKYLAENRPPRLPQTRPMSVGSSFDAYVKSYIVENLFGEKRSEFELITLFEKQVESQNRDWAMPAGKNAFAAYKQSGALADLMIELNGALDEPRFEFKVTKDIKHDTCIEGVTLLGYPDVYYINKQGLAVVCDWKVNGYCANSAKSPDKGYIMCRDGWKHTDFPPSRGTGSHHKDCQLMEVGGMTINVAEKMNNVNKDWARQISIYAWLLGEPIGSKFIACIEQLTCKPNGNTPLIRVASHRCRVDAEYQHELFRLAADIWERCRTGHVFDDLSKEENDARCKTLDDFHKGFDPDDPDDAWFQSVTRKY